MQERPLRFGILGSAKIARSFVQGLVPSTQVRVEAIASREARKAQEFAGALGIPRALGSYEALLADADIDAIYNPLPNGLHAEWSIRALNAGKHVLCEKPLCANAAEAHAMFAAAQRNGVYLAEGFPYLSQPQTLKMRQLLQAGTIGAPRLVQASFAFTLSDSGNVRWDASLAGGALMDIGVYPVSLILILARQRPARVQAAALWSALGSQGVDRALAATLEFESGLLAQIACSFEGGLHRQALIVGSDGIIETTFANHTDADTPGDLYVREGRGTRGAYRVIHTESTNGFLAEAESFATMVRQGASHWNGATPAESIDIMTTLDALKESARRGVAVEIAAVPADAR
jgi:D-xylose 1-dehydrogenase (NADP+, D-xylono-1,5-lactone-forming)